MQKFLLYTAAIPVSYTHLDVYKRQVQGIIHFYEGIIQLVYGPNNGLVFCKCRIERRNAACFIIPENAVVAVLLHMALHEQEATAKYYTKK